MDDAPLGPVYAAPGGQEEVRGGFFGWGGKLVNKVMEKTKVIIMHLILLGVHAIIVQQLLLF